VNPELDEDGLRDWLVDYLVNTIGLSPDEIDCDASMNDLAVGSADAVVMIGELSELLGRQLSPVDLWQYPTVNALACYLTGGEVEPVPLPAAADGRGVIGEREPIAVIGVGCRFPGGVQGPDALWEFLVEGNCGIGKVPQGRWDRFLDGSAEDSAALATTTRCGGFLDDVAAFDAEFFEIPAGEADKMDPQQRLLLEVTSEALEHAGIAPQSLRHTQTGVFAGACLGEYGYLAASDLSAVDAWSGTGGAMSIIANRLSYFYDFRGPSVTVDTACSSSLVAMHLACQSLRSGESDTALAAGVNVLLTPAPTRSFDVAEAMSQSGGCHSFDASADGFVRSEGAGVIVLKRLSDALRDGDRVLAVVRGSAVNQDGRSNGLMAPNPAAQMAVLRAAYADAGVDMRDVDYVEAHGTGTLLGDPIEARALGTVLGRGRPVEDPLLIGSVKSNLGHMEAAAGVAGLAKAVLALDRGVIPATVGYANPNPHIPFESLRLKVVAEQTDWIDRGRPRRAGVSSFGFGGTNAHVVLEQAPAQPSSEPADPAPAVSTLVISGKNPARIAATAGMLSQWLSAAGPEVSLDQLAHTLNHHRGGHRMFATLSARDRSQAVAGLSALAAGHSAPGLVGPHDGSCRSGTVFVYSGQGSQWAGMGRQLLADEPAFAAAVDDVEPAFVEQAGFSLREVLESGEPVVGIDRIQPVLVGVQLALTALWRSYGVHPDAVIGHSMGEVSAAVVAGALSAADGLKVIATRSRLMARLSGQGAMALLEVSGDDAEEFLADYPDVSVAVEASPRQIVIAGPPDQVDAVIAVVAAQDRLARRVDVDVASHHSIIDPVLPDLRAELADLSPQPPSIPVFVTTGGRTGGQKRSDSGNGLGDGTAVFDAEHWVSNLRNPVRFTQAVAAAGAEHGTFIEISPNPVLTYAIDDTLTETHHHTVATLNRDDDDTLTFHTHLNETHTTRPPVTPHGAEPHIALPTTPWRHSHHWIPMPAPRHTGESAPKPGTVLGTHTQVAGSMSGHLWQARLVTQGRPYPGFRRIAGVDVVPPSVLIATLAAAAAECGADGVEDVRFDSPLTLDQPRAVQVSTDGETVTISSAPAVVDDADQYWIGNVTARVANLPARTATDDSTDSGAGDESGHDPASVDELMSDWGVEGRAFEWLVDSHESTPGRLRAEIVLGEAPPEASTVPPTVALLDAALDLARLVGPSDALMLPVAADSIHVSAAAPGTGRGMIDVRRREGADDDLVVDVMVLTGDRQTCVDLRGVRYQTVHGFTPSADPSTVAHVIDWTPWQPNTDAADGVPGSVAVLGRADAAQALQDRLSGLGLPSADPLDARYIIYVADTETEENDVDAATRLLCEVADIVSRLVDRGPRNPATLWILTRGVHEARSEESQRQSCLWALAGVIGAEQPQVWGGLVDIGPDDDIADSAAALSPVLHTPASSVMLLRDGSLLTSGLAPFPGEAVRPPLRCRPDGAYLITGGLGDLGLLMAGWLAQRGARHLVLLGRTGLPSARDAAAGNVDRATLRRVAAIRALERRGVSVETVAIDSGSADAMQAMLAKREDDGAAPIRGVIHAAGITEGQLLTDLEPERVRQTVWPKIAGAQVLHEAFPPGSLDFLYFIASAGSVFGVPGQAAYAAGNAYLDALARARHDQGDNTVSLDWVVWEGLGLGKDVQIVVDELERAGSRPVRPAEASAAWEYASRYDAAQVVMAPMQAADSAGAASQIAAPTLAWSLMSAEELRAELHHGLRAILAGELRIPEDQIEVDLPFAEMGLNSVMAISIRRQLEQFVGIPLSATMLFNHPTITSFADYLAIRLVPGMAGDDEDADEDSAGSVLDSLFDTVESTS
jgi:phthiocerol/phenolphthiocerol synthesis type-I polyketide synthase A